MPTADLAVPAETKAAGFSYFLAVHEARELLEDLGNEPRRTHEEKVRFLVYYAENDAYPDWACS